jgi:hypothetical protein
MFANRESIAITSVDIDNSLLSGTLGGEKGWSDTRWSLATPGPEIAMLHEHGRGEAGELPVTPFSRARSLALSSPPGLENYRLPSPGHPVGLNISQQPEFLHDGFLSLGPATALVPAFSGFFGAGDTTEGPVPLVIKRAVGQIKSVDIVPDIGFGEVEDGMDSGMGRVFPRGEVLLLGPGLLFIPPNGGDEAPEAVFDDTLVQRFYFQRQTAGFVVLADLQALGSFGVPENDQAQIPKFSQVVPKLEHFRELGRSVQVEYR